MNLNQRLAISTLRSLLVAAAAVHSDSAELKDNPYQVIIDRNPFNLKAAPLPIAKPPPPKIVIDVKLSGITTDATSKRAWFVIPPGPGRVQPECLDLAEGESHGTLRVIEINEQEGTVKILNGGTPVTLNFKENGLAAPTQSAARLYLEKRPGVRFVPNQRAAGYQFNSQRLDQVRPLRLQSQPRPAASRQSGVPTNALINLFQGRKAPSVQKSRLSQRLTRP